MKRISDLIQLITVCALVLGFSLAFVILPDRAVSDKENRTLTAMPALTADSLLSGGFTAQLGEYCADQFPLRDLFVALKAYAELAQGKQENNGVVYGEDGTLITRPRTGERLGTNLKTVADFAAAVELPVTVAALPRTADVFADALPATYPHATDQSVWEEFRAQTALLALNAPDLYTPLCEAGNYYRTDHHYTTAGAYQTYTLLSDALSYTPMSEDRFVRQTVAEDFCGTSMRTSGFYLAPRDEISLWRYEGDADYTVTADGTPASLYHMDALDGTDKYAVFLGGNHARVEIIGAGNRPRLLLIRDSFADSLAPFLAAHYDLTLVDLRYYRDSVRELARTGGYEGVLVFCSITELSCEKNFSYLNIP